VVPLADARRVHDAKQNLDRLLSTVFERFEDLRQTHQRTDTVSFAWARLYQLRGAVNAAEEAAFVAHQLLNGLRAKGGA
jgi:hypothetical protein